MSEKAANPLPRKILSLVINILVLIFSLSCLFPILWILMSSLKTQSEFMLSSTSLPDAFNLQNYFDVFSKTNMGVYLLNSARNTIISVSIIIIVSFLAAYVLARYKFFGRNPIYRYFIIGMMVPIHALLVPMYIQFRQAGLDNHWYTLLFPYVAFGIPISVLLIESYIGGIPKELEDAAVIDGCGFGRMLVSIMLPLAMPIIATVAIIQFFSVWNEFSFALILVSKDTLRTVPLGLSAFKGAHDINYPRMMAAIMITMLPVMALYFVFSKKIIEGMIAGAVKG